VDLEPLLHVRDVAVGHDFPLMLGLLAVGGDAHSPSLTLYFWLR
jgi:hypothetical protein